jgi:hypothetical protein
MHAVDDGGVVGQRDLAPFATALMSPIVSPSPLMMMVMMSSDFVVGDRI